MENVYLKECESRLTAISVTENNILAEFESTIFFPEGGGQSSDVGTATISGEVFKVIDVREEGHSVIHVCEKTSAKIPEIGATAILQIDWDHRFDNMQRHCGEHVLSGLLYSKYGGVNKGFHMGKDYMAIDISFENDEMYTELNQEMIDEIELDANNVIWSDLPVTTVLFSDKDDATSLPLRKALAVEHDISVVSVGNKDVAVDCVACCGTHPSSTGQIGLIKIYKVEKNKGMFRVYCEAGKRAFVDYRNIHNIISELGNKYSTVP
ncbi:MAG: alanyl-tRNA editing protein, partial [Eubacteriales bacterium]|nr:alanyl-tRNA editing protein [Eubacteriales bacterium]